MMSESIELLGKGVYKDIPDTLTLKAFPTITELDYVGAEDFKATMLDKILPECIEEDINFHHLLEIDFDWICRCLRFLNYGPYFTTHRIFCRNCGSVDVECQVDLRVIDCKPLPEDFNSDIVLKKGDLIDYDQEIHLHMLTIQEAIDLREDKLFKRSDGSVNTEFARVCYSISSMGTHKDVTPVTAKLEIEKKMSRADYLVLVDEVKDLTDFGLRAGGRCQCPQCHSDEATFIALADDRFFRPTVGDLRKGRNDRNLGGIKNISGSKATTV